MNLDGPGVYIVNSSGGITSQALPQLSTTAPGFWNLIIERNQDVVSSVTDTAGLNWSQRGMAGSFFENKLEYWRAPATTLKSGNVITVRFPTGAGFMSAVAFCVNGVNLSSPFDSNVGLPVVSDVDPVNISTNAQSTFIFAGLRGAWDPPTAGPGWIPIHDNIVGSFLCVEYQIVFAPQTNLAVTQTNGAGFANGVIADALVGTDSVFHPLSQQIAPRIAI